jgi:hypothetical protein
MDRQTRLLIDHEWAAGWREGDVVRNPSSDQPPYLTVLDASGHHGVLCRPATFREVKPLMETEAMMHSFHYGF